MTFALPADIEHRLAASEAEQMRRVAGAVATRGNTSALASRIDAGVLVSLGPNGYVQRLLATDRCLDVEQLDHVVEFFASRGLPPSVQITAPEEETIDRLRRSGFEPDWERVLCATVPARFETPQRNDITATEVDDRTLATWLDVLAEGNDVLEPAARAVSDEYARAAHTVNDSVEFLAHLEGRPVGCGSLLTVDGIGWLGGAATVPSHRRRGVQSTLLDVRLERAGHIGLDIVAATALSASASARNLVRAGFDVVAAQEVWTQR